MSNKLKFAVEDIHLLEDDSIDTSQFSLLRVDAFATGKSLHDTYVTEETLRRTAKTILQKPFVFAIDERFADLKSHDPKEVAGGFVPHNSRLDFKQLEDGRLMLSVDVLIWRRYSSNLIEYFQRDGGRKSVSVEIEIFESKEDPSSGLLEIINFSYNAITGLGDMIQSAIPNAEAVMAFAKAYKEAKDNYEFSSKYDELDFTIPESVKKNAKKSLEMKKGSSVALAMARYLIANDKITPERLKQINKFVNRKVEFDDSILGLYGGKQSKKWSDELIRQMNEIDSKQLSYYSDTDKEDEETVVPEGFLTEKTLLDNYLGMEDIKNMAKTKEELEAEEAEKKKAEQMAADEAEAEAKKKADEEAEAAKEKDEKKFSYAEIFGSDEDFAKMFADEEDDEEDEKAKFAQAKEEFGSGMNPAVMMSAMYAKMNKMAKKMAKQDEDSKVYMAENEELKKKFAEIEKGQKEFAVTSTLKELSESVVIPEDKLAEMKTESEKYSFAELDGWKNYAKALCFDFKAKKPKGKDEEDDNVIKYAFPFTHKTVTPKDDVWATGN